ncbi:type IV secretory pathway protease TraF-like protein (plasmid) [Bermanella marisrubri]|uniref:Type IV secretory pathway protease TraF-like protein n=1 Tax=Bermanella marisrubri TaxID=207949 RepID=Q1MY37_9GAMM|nr:S26 family signal peptidase [Bermanella marisrubri]EAT10859.1 Type IV secretory pathway protease TraF-like protein [Oceanobacter sp. RED65] [Bermanella marisrubri]QIZ85912.1 type IV secretory pathway protease TraF-like protein [Bermanella marisrubri]
MLQFWKTSRASKKKKILKYSLIAFFVIVFFSYAFKYISEDIFGVRLAFNISDSLPGYIYLVDIGEMPSKGDVALFSPPKNPYFPEQLNFMKIVKGISGDRVSVQNHKVLINGEEVGIVKQLSKSGKQLFPISPTSIPDGYFFMWTPHKDSYDSRYKSIGLINESDFVGTARRIY